MGNGVYGMKTAAQYYYGKDLKELSLAQLAMLAGIPNRQLTTTRQAMPNMQPNDATRY